VTDRLHRLCALVTGLEDRLRASVEAASGLAGVAPDALLTVGHVPGLRVDDLAAMLRVSHSGAVRTVDRLVAAGLVERRPAPGDRRSVALRLTPAGRRARRRVLDARDRVLDDALGVLAPGDRATFGALVDRLLAGLAAAAGDDHSLCRRCDPDDCAEGCPVDVSSPSSAGSPAGAGSSPPRWAVG
jgi:DNA-binding MarR family transcriptional regulator